MSEMLEGRYTAFAGMRRLGAGELAAVALVVKGAVERGERAPVIVFDDATGEQFELDVRGTAEEVLGRLPAAPEPPALSSGPGRPKLGVVAREVTLLPRHWEWLNRQPGGASVALRKLVEQARREHAEEDRVRQAQEAAYRVLSALAGDLPGFEEAVRALYTRQRERFDELTAGWPEDVRDYGRRMAEPVW